MQRTLLAILFLAVGTSAVAGQEPKKQPAPTRVAVVNLVHVLNNVHGPRFKEMLDAQAQAKDGKKLEKRQEEALVSTWQEVQKAVQTVATQNGIDLVLGYGDPTEEQLLDRFPNVNRKMQAMDLGSTVPMFVTPGIDISQTVVRRLNKSKPEDAEGKPEKAAPSGTDRVVVVNIGYVFNKYKKAIKFKRELEQAFEPFKKEARKMRAWEDLICARNFDGDTEENLRSKINQAKRRLEFISQELSRELGKKQEEFLVDLWKDVQVGIKTYAIRNKIDLVLGYGDPIEAGLLHEFPNVNRKMQAMDLGSAVPLFAPSNIDIAEGVTRLLNDPDEAMVKFNLKSTRVSVAEISHIFNKYERAVKLRQELDAELAPLKQEEAKLVNFAVTLEGKKSLQEMDAVNAIKRRLEDMRLTMTRLSGTKRERNVVTVWKDTQAGIKSYAAKDGIGLVLGYGDPLDKDALDQFPNVNRKMQAMDLGSIVPLFVSPRANVSGPVTKLLNKQSGQKIE